MTGCPGCGASPLLSIPVSTCHRGWPDPRRQLWWSGTKKHEETITHMYLLQLNSLPEEGKHWWTFLSCSLRHRLLEALRVASLWHHGNNTNHATPVLSYVRLAFTHTLKFLSKVSYQQILLAGVYFHTLEAACDRLCACLCADWPVAHARRECIAGSCWSGAVGRAEICQIKGMSVKKWYLYVCVCVCV